MEAVALRVHFNCTAVSYPGVGRFRRAETGILGRARRRESQRGSLFLMDHRSRGISPGLFSPLVNLPQRSGTRVASHLDVIERAKNFPELGKLMAFDRPLRCEFAVAVRDEDAAAHKSASRKRIFAEKRSRRPSRHVRPNDNFRWKTICNLWRRLLQK